jgi:hypothetical protein
VINITSLNLVQSRAACPEYGVVTRMWRVLMLPLATSDISWPLYATSFGFLDIHQRCGVGERLTADILSVHRDREVVPVFLEAWA